MKEYLQYLEMVGLSKQTIKTYEICLTKFDITKPITLQRIEDFKKQLHATGVKPGTINLYMNATRSYLRYLRKAGIDVPNPAIIEMAKVSEPEVKILNKDELNRLLNCEALSLRDRAIINVLFSTGARLSELISMDRSDVRSQSNEMSITGKGMKCRVVFLSPAAAKHLSDYLATRTDNDPALFVGNGKKRLGARTIQKMLSIAAKKSGISRNVTPHMLRHCFATNLLENGADLVAIKDMLGHSFISTTMRYMHVTNKHLKESFDKYHCIMINKENVN